MFKRDMLQTLARYQKFPVVAILGPRQSGKTTIAKAFFKNHQFINLEDPDMRAYAKNDPKDFLKKYRNEHGLIIDEFQYVPELMSYIQVEVDEMKKDGYFILTGSQNFLMNRAITQSLAGRVGILTLLPLSLNELKENNLTSNIDKIIFQGSYPRLYEKNLLPT